YTTSDGSKDEVKAAKQRLEAQGLRNLVNELSMLWIDMAETDEPDSEQAHREQELVAQILALPSLQAYISELEGKLLAL
ncbi:hypothetical protein G3I24_20785, partial [Micromonospora aurantiaca]|nr:hypothetical protein [Micromonospora aurantiaca]